MYTSFYERLLDKFDENVSTAFKNITWPNHELEKSIAGINDLRFTHQVLNIPTLRPDHNK